MKTKGFTLIELLAVIAILIIILLIAVATINSVLATAKRGAFKSNAQLVLEGVAIKTSETPGFDPFSIDEFSITADLSLEDDNYDYLNISSYNNENYIVIIGQNKWDGLTACGTPKNMKVVDSDDTSSCDKPVGVIVERTVDTTPGAFGGGDGSTCNLALTIDSIEDLVYLSNRVNAGVTYSGYCIKLAVNLDFLSKRSYINYARTDYGDINGNGFTEGLRTELTTLAGFKSIGDNAINTHRFAGTFRGNTKTIYNLYINRSATDYVGLFGYNIGNINTLNLEDAYVNGHNYTGGLIGYNDNTLTDSTITGDINGTNYVGLACGRCKVATGIMVEGDVTGASYVGGLGGEAFSGTTAGINKGGNVTGTSNYGRIVGEDYAGPTISGLAMSSVQVNGSTVNQTFASSFNGTSINSMADINDINVAEEVLDTYIGGDNDGNGYYWDYNESGTLIHKNTTTDPLIFGLSGGGTTVDPYLINNYTDLKQATLRLGSVHKINSDIDLTGEKLYKFGGVLNKFTGTLDGNEKTISNLTIPTTASKGSNIGLVGYNSGTIKGLKLTLVNVTGGNYTGSVVGYNNNIMKDIIVTGDIVGHDYVGLACGYCRNATSIMVEGDVTGVSNVGGIAGYINSGTLTGVNKGGAIIATGSYVGRIVGEDYAGPTISGSAISSITVNGSTVISGNPASFHGLDITASDLLVSTTYTNRGFNFTNEALDYIWELYGTSATFRAGTS